MTQIIKFIEGNVDGCGTDVEVSVLLKTDCPLTCDHKSRLETAIKDIREEWDEDDWDTDSVVEEAMRRVFVENQEYEVIVPDVLVEF